MDWIAATWSSCKAPDVRDLSSVTQHITHHAVQHPCLACIGHLLLLLPQQPQLCQPRCQVSREQALCVIPILSVLLGLQSILSGTYPTVEQMHV